jgi:hypothetical protein
MRASIGIYEDPNAPLSTKDIWSSPSDQTKAIASIVGMLSVSLAASTLAVAKWTDFGKSLQERYVP